MDQKSNEQQMLDLVAESSVDPSLIDSVTVPYSLGLIAVGSAIVTQLGIEDEASRDAIAAIVLGGLSLGFGLGYLIRGENDLSP